MLEPTLQTINLQAFLIPLILVYLALIILNLDLINNGKSGETQAREETVKPKGGRKSLPKNLP